MWCVCFAVFNLLLGASCVLHCLFGCVVLSVCVVFGGVVLACCFLCWSWLSVFFLLGMGALLPVLFVSFVFVCVVCVLQLSFMFV